MSSSEAAARATGPIQSEEGAARPALRQLVVCSLKAWDEVWNRNNFLTDALLRRNPDLRVLFVEPPVDPLFELSERRLPTPPRLRTITSDGRLRVLRPIKPLPRRVGPLSDALLRIQVRAAARQFRLSRPVLWINDVTYAPLIDETSWRSVYDVSDDWLLAPFATREIQRLRDLDELALAAADQVVVCSQALARTRGAVRSVWLVPNAVDVAHFRNPRPRPGDLPSAPVALYAGTAHDARIDVDLVAELADRLPRVSIVFVGPNAFSRSSQQLLDRHPNIVFLGARPYRELPAYLQHADVVVVPHRVSPFMESLDPIKAYECMAISTPTVAIPLAGFREHSDSLNVVPREKFAERVEAVLGGSSRSMDRTVPPSWDDRAEVFEAALRAALGVRSESDLGAIR
jgi:teichuronic acid biosynthesis glycosyltransferase TuaH